MIDIKVLGSGSKGNSYLITLNDKKILLEAGLTFKTIQKKLNHRTSSIDFALISHEHQDHSKAVKDLVKNGIDVYLTTGTKEQLQVKGHRVHEFELVDIDEYKELIIDNVYIKPFRAIHDAVEPVSFYIKGLETGESLLFVTDSAYMIYKIPKVDVLMIECNFIKTVIDEKLEQGLINLSLRNRIVENHMSLESLLEALKLADLSSLKKKYVLHLSDNNSDENIILEEIAKVTKAEIYIC